MKNGIVRPCRFSERHKYRVFSIDESKLESRRGDRKKANVSSYVLPSSSIFRAPIEALRKTIYATNAVILSRHQCRCKSVASASQERRQISPLHRHCRPHKVVGTPQMRSHSRESGAERGRRPSDYRRRIHKCRRVRRSQIRIHLVGGKSFEDARSKTSTESPTEEYRRCSSMANVHCAKDPMSAKSVARRKLNTRCRGESPLFKADHRQTIKHHRSIVTDQTSAEESEDSPCVVCTVSASRPRQRRPPARGYAITRQRRWTGLSPSGISVRAVAAARYR